STPRSPVPPRRQVRSDHRSRGGASLFGTRFTFAGETRDGSLDFLRISLETKTVLPPAPHAGWQPRSGSCEKSCNEVQHENLLRDSLVMPVARNASCEQCLASWRLALWADSNMNPSCTLENDLRVG